MTGSGIKENWDILSMFGTRWVIMGMPARYIVLLALYCKTLITLK